MLCCWYCIFLFFPDCIYYYCKTSKCPFCISLVHNIEELQDYICVGQDRDDGDTRAVLFVKVKKGYAFTQQLKEKIAHTISRELWVDYVPQVIREVADIPYNLNNKRMESVVRKILATNKIPEVNNIKNPECLKYYVNIPELVNYYKK
ncbi:acetoacetyl-CoA synthetase-like [Stegodyphus dumicola]|uniref:acetoacetyl-CoA synthetase-like n=1 Tax=Stegodyphus dumicola TaxID=202533 RepID=UPI0015B056E6|nr:acetoacetyl-CoA synthetase-like [Stegodyphus dumicola]